MSSLPPDPEKPAPAAIMAEQDALPAGTRFGELEILRVLGVGGFGIVYLARDHSLEREVALKEYMPCALAVRGQGPQITVRSGALSETYAAGLRSFINEARLLAKFDHPSLVKVYRFWEDNATAYMVMPYLQGRTLREARRAMPTPPDEAWMRSVIDPILGAIEVLHREGVFHRDIAPDNILLPHGGPPVLLDFGAARRVIGDRTQSLTAILKPSYAPIEQYAEMTSLRQGPWTDLYALGAVLHFLLAGTPPAPATARALQDEMQPLWTRSFPGVSQRFLAAVDWALAVRPQERPQNVDALRAAFDGRTEPPVLARTVPGRTSLMPVGDARTQAGYEPTQAATAPAGTVFPATVRDPVRAGPAPASAAPATTTHMRTTPTAGVAPAAPTTPPAPVATRAAPPNTAASRKAATAPGPSRKGLVGAALAVVAVLAAAAGWQVLEPRPGSTPVAAEAASSPVVPVATIASEPGPAPVATQDVPAAAAPPAVAEAPVPVPAPAVTMPVATTPAAAPYNPIPPPAAGEMTRAERARAFREALRAQRQARQEAAVPTSAANVPLGSAMPGSLPLGATLPGDVPLGAAPTGPATAREACGGRVRVALWTCLQRECRRPRYAHQAECLRVDEELRSRELQ